jgi:predicted DNA binding CopG/RHH family protein
MSRENASPQKPLQTKKKVTIKLPEEELKHVAMSQEDPEDQEEDVASDVELYNWKTQHLKANLVHGKFTKKEDEELKKAIFHYIRVRSPPLLPLIDACNTLLVSSVNFSSILSCELPQVEFHSSCFW